ncbi:MAG TPA: 5'/3'-nucleotidase SurE, partial [Clostridia bacterium]|nr:5'/3'-nucleotidase SurE [Clostridia bacterium]
YSGTVSAAMEGAILGYRSFAVSLCLDLSHEVPDMTETAKYTMELIEKLYEIDMPKNIIYNINLPCASISQLAGTVFTSSGIRKYSDKYISRKDPWGKTYYWLSGSPINDQVYNHNDTDIEHMKNNHVTIVPMSYDLTDYAALQKLKGVKLD